MSDHTPGPWRVGKGKKRIYCKYGHVADVHGVDNITGGTAEANARLIAAAPETAAERDHLKKINADLLELVKLIDGVQCNLPEWWYKNGYNTEIKAAIEKAEGGK